MTCVNVLGTYWFIRIGEGKAEFNPQKKHISLLTYDKDELREMIIMAFIYESGNAPTTPEWFAVQGEKIYLAWKDAEEKEEDDQEL